MGSMFNYTILSEREMGDRIADLRARKAHRLLLKQTVADAAVRRGLKKINMERNISMAALRKRILKERWAGTSHMPCPLLEIGESVDGPVVHVYPVYCRDKGVQLHTIIPLRDYWTTVLSQ
jgi:hypothetical protein